MGRKRKYDYDKIVPEVARLESSGLTQPQAADRVGIPYATLREFLEDHYERTVKKTVEYRLRVRK